MLLLSHVYMITKVHVNNSAYIPTFAPPRHLVGESIGGTGSRGLEAIALLSDYSIYMSVYVYMSVV